MKESSEKKFAPALIFQDISYTIEKTSIFSLPPFHKKKLNIIKDCNGFINRGELVAILGSSGAGKTTLLDVLAKRKTFGVISGTVLYNGKVRKERNLPTNVAGYVRQEDYHLASLTVRETMLFAADLRCRLPREEKEKKVDQLINALSLTRAAHSHVGDQLKRGISGGEARRLSIGVEMLNDPDLLFLDEPTSGLDASSAYNVTILLRKLVHKRKNAAICTIHQPSIEVFEMFDKVILLTKTELGFGSIIFCGKPAEVAPYFARLGHPVPPRMNPADHMIQICSVERDEKLLTLLYGDEDAEQQQQQQIESLPNGSKRPEENGETEVTGSPTQEDLDANRAFNDHPPSGSPPIEPDISDPTPSPEEEKARVQYFFDCYQASIEASTVLKDIEESKSRPSFVDRESKWKPLGTVKQITVLTRRKYQELWNDRPTLIGRVVVLLVLAAILSSGYWNLKYDSVGVENRVSLIFFLILTSYMSSEPFFGLIPRERILTAHEKGAKLYSTLSYFISTSLTVIPLQLSTGFIYVTTVYWCANLRHGFEHYAIFTIEFSVLVVAMIYYALMLGAALPNVEAAMGVSAILFSLFLLFDGFLLIYHSIPSYWIWANWISPFKYAFYVAMNNEFNDVLFTCTSDCGNSFSSGNELLQFYGAENHTLLWPYIAVTAGFLLLFSSLTFISLKFIHHERR